MAQLPVAFNANDVEPGGKVVAEAAFTGWHPMHFTESEMKETQAKNGRYLQLVATVIDGQWKGRKLWVTLNLENQNQQTVEIAYRELSSICRAVGRMNISDSQQLHLLPFLGYVEYEPPRDKYGARNALKQYKPIDGPVAAQAMPTPAPGYAPPATAAAQSTPPWARKAG